MKYIVILAALGESHIYSNHDHRTLELHNQEMALALEQKFSVIKWLRLYASHTGPFLIKLKKTGLPFKAILEEEREWHKEGF